MSYHDNPPDIRRRKYRNQSIESDQEILNALQDVTVYLGVTESKVPRVNTVPNYARAKDALDIAKQVLLRRIGEQRKRQQVIDEARKDVRESMSNLIKARMRESLDET